MVKRVRNSERHSLNFDKIRLVLSYMLTLTQEPNP